LDYRRRLQSAQTTEAIEVAAGRLLPRKVQSAESKQRYHRPFEFFRPE
jgi:hypothetical protein